MAISDLISVVPPPESPDESGSIEDLAVVEDRMGLTLPTDYRELAVRYGSGWFVDTYLHINNPFVIDILSESTSPNGRCYARHEWGVLPWQPFCDGVGTLEVGNNENGDLILFLAEGEPDSWSLLVVPHGADRNEFERWDLPLATFLAKAFLNEIRTHAVHVNLEDLILPYERRFTRRSDLKKRRVKRD